MDIFDFRKRAESRVDERTERWAEAAIGAAIEVHRHLGPGMPEKAYRNALCHELGLRGIPTKPKCRPRSTTRGCWSPRVG